MPSDLSRMRRRTVRSPRPPSAPLEGRSDMQRKRLGQLDRDSVSDLACDLILGAPPAEPIVKPLDQRSLVRGQRTVLVRMQVSPLLRLETRSG